MLPYQGEVCLNKRTASATVVKLKSRQMLRIAVLLYKIVTTVRLIIFGASETPFLTLSLHFYVPRGPYFNTQITIFFLVILSILPGNNQCKDIVHAFSHTIGHDYVTLETNSIAAQHTILGR